MLGIELSLSHGSSLEMMVGLREKWASIGDKWKEEKWIWLVNGNSFVILVLSRRSETSASGSVERGLLCPSSGCCLGNNLPHTFKSAAAVEQFYGASQSRSHILPWKPGA